MKSAFADLQKLEEIGPLANRSVGEWASVTDALGHSAEQGPIAALEEPLNFGHPGFGWERLPDIGEVLFESRRRDSGLRGGLPEGRAVAVEGDRFSDSFRIIARPAVRANWGGY